MAMAIRINTQIAKSGAAKRQADRITELIENPPDKMEWIRLPGTSAHGPCRICSPYFGMTHDKSGKTVPLIQLHPNGVCRDVPVELAGLVTGEKIKRFEKFKWLEEGPGKDQQLTILGKTRARMVKSGAIGVADLYKKPKSPLSNFPTLTTTANKILRQTSKAALLRSALELGVEGARQMTRAELVNAISAREIK